MMKFVFVASGSKGNASLIQDGDSLIQIDMGVSKTELKNGLAVLNKEIQDTNALFITHDHADHIKGIRYVEKSVPVYASFGTYPVSDDHILIPNQSIKIGSFEILPFSVSHDAKNPVNYIVKTPSEKLGYVTDVGYLTEENLDLLKDCDYYLFESNHDLKMLRLSKRPQTLKQRIRGDSGHLSNIDSAKYMVSLIGPHTKRIFLSHLSEECNTPELALETYRKVFAKSDLDFDAYGITPLKQWEMVLGGDL